MDDQQIQEFKEQKRNFTDFGFNQWLERLPAVKEGGLDFLSTEDVNSLFQGISASKSTQGIQKSPSGLLEINWDAGTITVNFPGGLGFMKFGNVGTDTNGNAMLGILLNDGTTDRWFGGYQKGGF